MADKKKIDDSTGMETTGHVWDGIEELNSPLPRWWVWIFYVTIIWGIGYTIAYPAWPMISKATAGMMGYSTRAQVAEAINAHEAKNAALVEDLKAVDMTAITDNADLHRYAVARGKSVFAAQCSQCHGAGAAGASGYPNLLDDDWLWGGSLEEIAFSVRHGVRNATDDDARYSEMPVFGEFLEEEEIEQLADIVMALPNGAPTGEHAVLWEDNCASCHGDAGLGDREYGAPNLADAISLFGGDRDSVVASITNAPFGVMPAWGQRLKEEDVRAVSTYVHSLGGGE